MPDYEDEKAKCHWCQLRSFPTHDSLPITIVHPPPDGEDDKMPWIDWLAAPIESVSLDGDTEIPFKFPNALDCCCCCVTPPLTNAPLTPRPEPGGGLDK